jgi:hypothetical protein
VPDCQYGAGGSSVSHCRVERNLEAVDVTNRRKVVRCHSEQSDSDEVAANGRQGYGLTFSQNYESGVAAFRPAVGYSTYTSSIPRNCFLNLNLVLRGERALSED